MRCLNEKCGKNIHDFLTLQNGSIVCPHCCHPLIKDDIDFTIDKNNQELYELGMVAFLKWLKSDSANDKKKLANRANEYLREAANYGHPLAILMMGYLYDFDVVDVGEDYGEDYRCRIAYHYYRSLFYSDKGLKNVSVDFPHALDTLNKAKLDAANNALSMLRDWPERLAINPVKYSYSRLAKNLAESKRFDLSSLEIDYSINDETSDNDVNQQILDFFEQSSRKNYIVKYPVYGVFKITCRKLQELFTNEKFKEAMGSGMFANFYTTFNKKYIVYNYDYHHADSSLKSLKAMDDATEFFIGFLNVKFTNIKIDVRHLNKILVPKRQDDHRICKEIAEFMNKKSLTTFKLLQDDFVYMYFIEGKKRRFTLEKLIKVYSNN